MAIADLYLTYSSPIDDFSMSKRRPKSRTVSPAYLDRVKEKWNRYGATQEDFAKELGINVGTFRNFLDGEPVLKRIFDEICHALDLPELEISEPISELPIDINSPFIIGNPIIEPRYFFWARARVKTDLSITRSPATAKCGDYWR